MSPNPVSMWDEKSAQALVGKRVLIGLTFAGTADNRQEQMIGVVIAADALDGFEIALEGALAGGRYRLPPDPTAFHPATPGRYQMRNTGETVLNPDYLSTWTIQPAAE